MAIGVDTHKEMHVAVALDAVGAQLDSQEIATGAGLARFLERAGVAVYECERPRRQERRRGKNDLVDAALAARRLVAGEGLSLPRGGGRREDLRLLLLERRGAMQARDAALNQLSALVVTAPEQVRERLGGLAGERLARAAARLRPRPDVVTGVLRRLGNRAERLSKEIADAERTLASCSPRSRLSCSRSAE